MINGSIIAGFTIHVFLNFLMFFHPDVPEFGAIMLPFTLANLIGIILMAAKKVVAGARVFMISSVFFVPIGLIGAMGAKKAIDNFNAEKFNNKTSI